MSVACSGGEAGPHCPVQMQHEMRLLGARRDLGCFDQLKSLSMLDPWEVQGGEMALQGYLPAPASSSVAGGTDAKDILGKSQDIRGHQKTRVEAFLNLESRSLKHPGQCCPVSKF